MLERLRHLLGKETPMLALFAAALAQAAAAPPALTPNDPAVARMLALYDEICLQTFPIDGEVDRLMAAKGARALTPDQVKVTLGADPGRAWMIEDGGKSIQVTLELPPYHACSVRRMTAAGLTDPRPYRALADRFEADHPRFQPLSPYDTDKGVLHIHATGDGRVLASGTHENLLVYDQHVTDPARRAAGETLVNLRFVHQIVTPDAK